MPHALIVCFVLDSLAPHELLVIARKRRDVNQADAARRVGLGLHDYVAIENGRLIPTLSTVEGLPIAEAIEREFGIPASSWISTPSEAA